MDPLSLTASIIAILQATATLVSYVNDVKDAPSDQARFAKETQSLSDLLTNLICRLCEGKAKSEVWYSAVEALGKSDGPLGQYKTALERLQRKIKGGEGLARVGNVLLWKFVKEEVASILLQIERIKSLILIALQMDHLELSRAIKDCLAKIHNSNEELQIEMSAVLNSMPMLHDGIKKIQVGQDRQQNQQLLQWISSTDFPSQLSDIIARRQAGTCQWFLELSEFNNWLSGTEKTLFCPGIPGAGKTMVSAIAVDQLYETTHNHSIGVAYVFCNYKMQSEQNTLTLLSAILKQQVQAQPSAPEAANALYKLHSDRGTMATLDEISNILKVTLKSFSTVYVVVDALDECSDEHKTPLRLLERLRDLQNDRDIRLMITSRFIPEIQEEFKSAPKLEVRANPEDVAKFVKGKILRLHRCVQRDDELKREVEERIVEAVDGMFLLARLHVDSLLDKTTKSKVRAMLKGLSSEELLHALSVNPGETDLDRDNFEDMDDIVSFCAGLVTVDDKSNIIRLIHYTTQEYFLQIRQDWNPTAQKDITTTCLTYISFGPFKTGVPSDDKILDDILETYVFFDYASQHWVQHAMPVQEQVLDLALIVLKDMELVSYLVYSMSKLRNRLREPSAYGLHRMGCMGVHLTAKLGLNYLLGVLLGEIGDAGIANVRDVKGQTPLSWAAKHGQTATVKLLVERDDVDANSKDDFGLTPLSLAAGKGHIAIVKFLLEQDDVNAELSDNYGQTPLAWSAAKGRQEIVKLLIERDDVNADSKDNGGRTPLAWSALRGDEEIAKLLVERDDVNADSKDNEGQTPLSLSAKYGLAEIVQLLVDRDDVNANSKDNSGWTPLTWSAAYNHEETVKLLVERDDVNADSKDKDGGTPLLWSAAKGHQEIVKLLVERDDVNADLKDIKGRIPLSWLAEHGQAAIVQLLVDRDDVNADSKDNYGWTPLT
ncbi:hypothetical protein VE02_03298 [Pseudogymnoascus sp. 03VT05]|nr:hypothetical protein VE02_03298 [Pseudogymnoascus sp. 03VT05]